MLKRTEVTFVNKELKQTYESLEDNDQVKKAITKAIDDLKKSRKVGKKFPDKILRNKKAKEFVKKHNLKNIWHYNLTSSWRLLYTVAGDDIEILAIILNWLDHKDYDRLFGF